MSPVSRILLTVFRPAHREAPVSRVLFATLLVWLASCWAGSAIDASASQDPNRTLTIYVHGFDRSGASQAGVYGDDDHEPLADSVAALVGLPVSQGPDQPLAPNAVVGTTYYGDTPPAYYSDADRAEIDQLTRQWGGGVPRYAAIVAKYARHELQRSGAQQVNFVSASFGALVVRWLIEKNVEGLAAEGKIGRWLTIEGVLAGNWVASHDDLVNLLGFLEPAPIDVAHMRYDWIETNLHAPRTDASSPDYAGILIGHVGSTDDSHDNAALRAAMLTYNDYHPNDGVQSLPDTRFQTIASASRYAGMPPTFAVFHSDHLGLADVRSAWAEAATFLTSSRRVTVTMTSARVTNLHEPQLWYWNWTPAEVLFESRVFSPRAEARWGITQPLSAYVKEGAAIPMRRYRSGGETQTFSYVLFDDFVLPDETQLRLELHGVEVDYDPRYGVVETAQAPYYDDMGGGTLFVSTSQPGTYTFTTADWSCQLAVNVFTYPFASLVGVGDAKRPGSARGLLVSPNPSRSAFHIRVPGAGPGTGAARLEIADVAGRIIRRIEGDARLGFVWDGRDERGQPVPVGVYVHRVVTALGSWSGRSCVLR